MANTYEISLLITMIFCITVAANPWSSTSSFRNRLHHDNYSITQASQDYGNIVHQTPSSVLDPSSVNDIVDLVRSTFYRSYTTTIAARGHGHSLRGQDMTRGGVVVNMTALTYNINRFLIGGNYYADVDGGMLWIDVLRETLKYGLAPISWTDYLYLTVGGTLSNAGISGQTFLHGPQIANVLQLDVVTGKGEFITCSKYTNSELFFGVLGGLGQFGIITRARIVLQKAPKMTRWVRLIYSDFSLFTKDQEYLISTNNINNNNNVVSYVEGFIIINASATSDLWRASNFSISSSAQSNIDALLRNNHGILYSIELAKYYDNQTEIECVFETMLKRLNFVSGLEFRRDVPFFDFINRLIDLDTPEMGSKLFHPWLNLFVPKSNITDFNRLFLVPKLPTLHKKPDIYVLYPINKDKWDDRMSAVTPSGENVIYTVGLLHSTPNDYKRFDAFNRDVLRICEKAGLHVKLYLPDYKTQDEWTNHFGPSKWKMFYSRKKMFDPKNILSPGQGIWNSNL